MNVVTKTDDIEHRFDYNGEEVQIVVNKHIAGEAYKEYKARYKKAVEEDDALVMAEVVVQLVLKWNLEDNAGDIPLETGEIFKRVPIDILVAAVNEAQKTFYSGGVTKKSES